MNLNTGIEWVINPDGTRGATWNPIVGCRHGCWYCYARQLSKRQACMKCQVFRPHIHPERIFEPLQRKKPTTIFVGSMSDMWGDWVPAEWIESVLDVIRACPQHTFLTLTKNPKRYHKYRRFPINLWSGVTVTGFRDAKRLLDVYNIPGFRFLSLEPLLDGAIFDFHRATGDGYKIALSRFDAIIIGPLNKRGHGPVTKREWVERITAIADDAGVKVFYKNALHEKDIMTEAEVKARQLTPWGG